MDIEVTWQCPECGSYNDADLCDENCEVECFSCENVVFLTRGW